MSQVTKNYINGEWVDSSSGKTFDNINPSNIDEVIGKFADSNSEDVNNAVAAAKATFKPWSSTPAPERGEILFRAGAILKQRQKELAAIISRENGKTVKGAMGDVQAAIDMAFFAGGEGRRWLGDTTHSGLKKRFAMTKRYPIGVLGIFPSWNFPMALTGWKTLPALVCGNTIVLKSEENCPQTTGHFVEIMEEAGLPKGVLNLIHGKGPSSGEAITLHPDVRMVTFTGSSAVGKIIAKNITSRLGKVSLELGGKNGIIVMDDANLELAANGAVVGAFSISGQRCTATSRVIVHKNIYDKFIELLVEKTSKLKVGPGSDDSSDVTPMISKKQQERVLGFIERARGQGANIRIGGNALKGGDYDKGYYIEPTIIDNVGPDKEISCEEVFGPVLTVLKVNSYEDAVKVHNSSKYGLSASIFTNNVNIAFNFFDDIESGVCYVNAPTYGSETHLPFGGVKESGQGYRETGRAAIESFSELRTLYVDYSAKIQTAQEKK